MAVFGDVAQVGTCLGIIHHSAAGHLDDLVLTILTATLVLRTIATVPSKGMTVVAQVQQRPIVTVTAQDDMSSTSAVTSIRATIGVVLHATHVCAAAAALT